MIRIAALAISVPLLFAQTERAALHEVTGVRHSTLANATRVSIEISGRFKFVTERLHNPERVYYDFANTRPRIDSKRLYNEAVDGKMLKRIRVAETVPGVTRVVLDLGDAV